MANIKQFASAPRPGRCSLLFPHSIQLPLPRPPTHTLPFPAEEKSIRVPYALRSSPRSLVVAVAAAAAPARSSFALVSDPRPARCPVLPCPALRFQRPLPLGVQYACNTAEPATLRSAAANASPAVHCPPSQDFVCRRRPPSAVPGSRAEHEAHRLADLQHPR